MAEVTVHHRFIHQAPRKLRLVSNMIKGLPVSLAIARLDAAERVAAKPVRDLIISGISAAKEKGLNTSNLIVALISVDEGPKLRRFIPLSRGRSQRIVKQMSHLHLNLLDEPQTNKEKSPLKNDSDIKQEVSTSKVSKE